MLNSDYDRRLFEFENTFFSSPLEMKFVKVWQIGELSTEPGYEMITYLQPCHEIYYNTLADASKQCTASSMCWMPPDPGEIYTAEVVRKVDAAIAKAKAQLSNVTSLQRQRMENQIKLWETAKGTF